MIMNNQKELKDLMNKIKKFNIKHNYLKQL
jgi:hypothetical protein